MRRRLNPSARSLLQQNHSCLALILTAGDLAEIPWAAKTFPEGAFVSKDSLFKDGRRVVLSPLAAHEPVLRSKITEPGQRGTLSSLLEKGLRAVTIRVDDVRGVAGFILPGDYVDVVLIAEVGCSPARELFRNFTATRKSPRRRSTCE